jgi:hypothetical protein
MSGDILLRYRGLNREGTSVTGVAWHTSASAFIEGRFDRRWQLLTVWTNDGREVGGIAPRGGKQSWWAES